MNNTYNYYAGLTSQLPFCNIPLRLDSYNTCQFGCGYCFARTRQGFGRKSKMQYCNPDSLEMRLKRVLNGRIESALDEFIEKRIPFQLGGMSDPFTIKEKEKQITLRIIEILKYYNYPFLISTKNNFLKTKKYLQVIQGANTYVRFSTTVISNREKKNIDKGCPSLSSILKCVEKLSEIDIPVSFRLQPIIPGYESYAYELIDKAYLAGVKHISIEYLKVPIDANKKFSSELIKLLDNNPIKKYISLGANKNGREYNLPLSYREEYLPKIYKYTKNYGMTFGFADNDLLTHSDGKSCCNASNLYLKEANYFEANIISVIKGAKIGKKISFNDVENKWMPKKSISRYINSKARIDKGKIIENEWLSYLKMMWTKGYSVYTPDYFDGVFTTQELDKLGLPIYVRRKSEFEKLLV